MKLRPGKAKKVLETAPPLRRIPDPTSALPGRVGKIGDAPLARENKKMKSTQTIPKPIEVFIDIKRVLGRQIVDLIRVSDGRVELTGFNNVSDVFDWNEKNNQCNTYGRKYNIVGVSRSEKELS